ncbi:MAG TPA: CPBP family glutamic-type intramembrane protease [Gemmatimonadales bacterium]|nr:CPBP family glutamic-type intramembrane protease [Gemmatimonadales bacterium]
MPSAAAPAAPSYWRATRAPRHSLLFALPLLVLYELLAFLLSRSQLSEVRNGADVLLKSVFVALGGRYGLTAFSVALLLTGAALVWRDRRRNGPVRPRLFLGMLAESLLYAALLGGVASTLTTLLLHGRLAIGGGAAPALAGLGLPTQLMISLGAGIYEELLFRVLLVSGLAALGRLVFHWRPLTAGCFAAVLGALVFSLFHYVGPLGDEFTLGSFTFRAIAGLLFSGLYLLRGFGITAWSHALYDVFLSLAG